MENVPGSQQASTMKQRLFDEGILDEQFNEMESLNSDEDPYFAETLVDTYFEHTKKLIANVEDEMAKTPINYSELDRFLVKLRGSCASVGAIKVKHEVNATREFCQQRNLDGVKAAFERVKTEHEDFKAKVDPYFQLLNQAKGPKS